MNFLHKNDLPKTVPYADIITVTVAIVGISLRLFHYFYNRSLWGDEALLTLNIINKNFAQLANFPLDYEQYAPLGFLWVQRLNTYLFGFSEQVLRLFPLICGISSIFLFWKLCIYLGLGIWEKIAAFTAFALSAPVIYYSVEAKQYETEVMVTLLCYLFYFLFREKKDLKSGIVWGICGSLCLWFSFPSVFILTSIGFVQTWKVFKNKNWVSWVITSGLWFINFVILYIFFITAGTKSDYLNRYWSENFFPIFTQPSTSLHWIWKTLQQILATPMGVTITIGGVVTVLYQIISILLLLIGTIAFYQKDKTKWAVLLIPALLLLIASALEKYPIFQRFLLFYVPVLLLLLGVGVGRTVNLLKQHLQLPLIVYYGMLGFLIFPIFFYSLFLLYKPSSTYNYFETREALKYIKKDYRVGDILVIDNNLIPIFYFYQKSLDLNMSSIPIESESTEGDSSSMIKPFNEQLRVIKTYKRVWFLARPTNLKIEKSIDSLNPSTLAYVPYRLKREGKQLLERDFSRTKLLLYQFK